MHDASAPNHVMNGIGSQYRSVIFYTEDVDGEAGNNDNGEHVAIIQRSVGKVQQTLPEGVTVATQVMSAGEFYPAEELHYGFYEQHPDSAYAVTVIAPKLRELKERFLGLFL
jgi:peptide-methionine (S)-S-oxide reductase